MAAWLLTLLATVTVEAQGRFQQPYRFEKVVKPSEEGITVISLRKEGLAIIQETSQYSQGKKKWHLQIIDTTLNKVWSTDLELEMRQVLVGFEYSPQHLYLVFRESDSDMYNLDLVNVQLRDRLYQKDKIKFELNFRLTHFTVAGSCAIFGGYVSSEPAVLLYNQFSDKPKVLPGLFIKDVTLLDIRANQNQSFNVLLSERKGKDDKNLVVRTYDQDGNLLIDDVIHFDPQFSILSGLTSTLELDEMVILGTYGENNDRQSLGLFSVVVDPFSEQPVTYTDFATLRHSLDYMTQAKAAKVREKAQRQKAQSQIPDYKALVSPMRIEERSNGFFLLVEMYNQSSGFDMNPYSPYYYAPPYSPRQNYYGYNAPYPYTYPYTPVRNSSVSVLQTMVIQFGMRGQVLRDASLKIDDVKLSSVEQVGDFTVLGDSVYMAYRKESDVFHISTTGEIEEKPAVNQTGIRLMDQYDALRGEDKDGGGLQYWYDHHLFVWGFQTIKNITKEGDKTRHVFYVNRISLQ